MDSFKDYFSDTAADYSTYRPSYPEPLFEAISANSTHHNLLWDCATGNGQAALGLSKYFRQIIATDASITQIENAFIAPNIEYRVATAESSGLADQSVDAVTVAQALHWFNHERFYAEVHRILKPGGLLAVWSYGESSIDDNIDVAIRNLNSQVLSHYWAPEVRYVKEEYLTIPFPFNEIIMPPFWMRAEWNLREYVGYLRTWSAIRQCIAKEGYETIAPYFDMLASAWGDPDIKRPMVSKLFVRAGTK